VGSRTSLSNQSADLWTPMHESTGASSSVYVWQKYRDDACQDEVRFKILLEESKTVRQSTHHHVLSFARQGRCGWQSRRWPTDAPVGRCTQRKDEMGGR
jgi:hypothetical protein